MSRRYKILSLVSAMLLIIGSCSYYVYAKTQQQSETVYSHTSSRYWIMTAHALSQVTMDNKARQSIENDTIYSPSYNPNMATRQEQGLHIIPVKTFDSEATLAADIAAGNIPSYVKAVLYDNEPWALTPAAEQQNPVLYYQRAYTIAHDHGYTFIATPVPNKIAPTIAPYADVVDVQAQYAQISTGTYLKAVNSIIEQVKHANPHAVVLSGISTNPTAGDPTPQQLFDIAKATYPALVHGWWLNIPEKGSACPKCHQPRPDTAIEFLRLLGAS